MSKHSPPPRITYKDAIEIPIDFIYFRHIKISGGGCLQCGEVMQKDELKDTYWCSNCTKKKRKKIKKS